MPRRRTPPEQLGLFSEEAIAAAPAERPGAALAARFKSLSELAERIPALVRFGTSSWSFPGWGGIVFEPGQSESFLAREGLRAYVLHPLLRTVGIDRGYYSPLLPADLQRYAAQLPAGFPCCAKAPSLYTTPVHLGHGAATRGDPNPFFLHAHRFLDEVVGPTWSVFREHTGPLILEFPPVPRELRLAPAAFVDRLEPFLEALPSELPVAVELRDKHLLTPAYASLLARRKVGHVYNYWSAMPTPAAQARLVPLSQAPFVVLRLMLRPGTRHDDRKAAFAPFDRILDPNPELRDEVVTLLRACIQVQRSAFVLVNNKAEGCAPLTIEALARALVAS